MTAYDEFAIICRPTFNVCVTYISCCATTYYECNSCITI